MCRHAQILPRRLAAWLTALIGIVAIVVTGSGCRWPLFEYPGAATGSYDSLSGDVRRPGDSSGVRISIPTDTRKQTFRTDDRIATVATATVRVNPTPTPRISWTSRSVLVTTINRLETATRPSPTTRDPALGYLVPPHPIFDAEAGAILLQGLQQRSKSIVLDPLFARFRVDPERIQEMIDHLFVIYRQVYFDHPEFFYLNGSFEVHYVLQRGSDARITRFSVRPTYWDRFAALDENALLQIIARVQTEIDGLTAETSRRAANPIDRLTALHDLLVRRIRYDTQSDQQTNNVASALLDGITLCQGYAQSFQWVGQKLGLDVRLISGEANGIGHAWNLVLHDGRFYHIDVTHDDPLPDEGGPVIHRNLMRGDTVMRKTHIWDADAFPKADQDGAFYYIRKGLTCADRGEFRSKLRKFLTSIDFKKAGLHQLELLYQGSPILDPEDLESLVARELSRAGAGSNVLYRADNSKGILLVHLAVRK